MKLKKITVLFNIARRKENIRLVISTTNRLMCSLEFLWYASINTIFLETNSGKIRYDTQKLAVQRVLNRY